MVQYMYFDILVVERGGGGKKGNENKIESP